MANKKEDEKKKRAGQAGTFKKTIAAISLFVMASPLLSGEPSKVEEKVGEVNKNNITIEKSTGTKKNVAIIFPGPDTKIPEHRTFENELRKKWEKEAKQKQMIKSIIEARHITAFGATRLIKEVNAPEKDKRKFYSVVNELAKMEGERKIRTSIIPAVLVDENESEEEKEKKMIEAENIPHAITITYYPLDKAMILYFLTDIEMKIEGEKIKYEKGTYLIIDEKGMREERNN